MYSVRKKVPLLSTEEKHLTFIPVAISNYIMYFLPLFRTFFHSPIKLDLVVLPEGSEFRLENVF